MSSLWSTPPSSKQWILIREKASYKSLDLNLLQKPTSTPDCCCDFMEPTFRYDVFLSFRGTDTRKNFTSHLYGALRRHNFDVFHDTSISKGLGIAPQLWRAILESRIFVVVFSTNYADSKWYLDELSQMMHCVHIDSQQMLLPVFMDVKQSHLHNEEAFSHHEAEFELERVQKWREALKEAGELHGLHLKDDANGDAAELVDRIVEKIRKMLHGPVADMHPLVGIESRIEEMMSMLDPSCNDDVRVVAVWGPAGIGKTTIAKATFDRLAIHFKAQYSCFLPDVKTMFGELDGQVTLQRKLLSNLIQKDESRIHIDSYHQGIGRIERIIKHQKVLLVFDDVDSEEQLKVLLALRHQVLGGGSRIIVTTRDESVVGWVKADGMYEPRLLDESESLEVFCWYAFGQDHPKEGYEVVTKEAVCWGAGRAGLLQDSAAHMRHFETTQQWGWALKDLMTGDI